MFTFVYYYKTVLTALDFSHYCYKIIEPVSINTQNCIQLQNYIQCMSKKNINLAKLKLKIFNHFYV